MAANRFRCDDCSAEFNQPDDAEAHEEARDHTVLEYPPEDATSRERHARGFHPDPHHGKTTEHDDVSVVDGERVGRRRADY